MNKPGPDLLTGAPALACAPTIRREVLSEAEAADLAASFHALADPTRLRLLNLIATADGGQACACDLVGPVERSQPTVSHHLKVLREAGLVSTTKRGTWVWYSVDTARVEALRRALGRR
jgi:ArsR family transcriptional regulator